MIYWFCGYPGIGKDFLAKKLSKLVNIDYVNADGFLTKKDKEKLVLGNFTSKDRLKKLLRIVKFIKSKKGNLAIGDSLPDNTSRKFLDRTLNKNVAFILVRSSQSLHTQRLRERKGHFFPENIVKDYIEKNWDTVFEPKHFVFNNKQRTPGELEGHLLALYKKIADA